MSNYNDLRTSNLTDEELIEWLYSNILIRKHLATHSKNIAYAGDVEESILLYSTGDFIRLAKILNAKVKTRTLEDDCTFEAEHSFMCLGTIIRVFDTEVLDNE